jgi:polyisoprenoid-binding protein YceI
MSVIAWPPGARRLFAISILARLPPAMLSIGLLVHAQHLTGSFASAGVVTGIYAIALGVSGPLLGGLVDQRGQTSVLLATATVAAALLVAVAVQPMGASLAVIAVLAGGIGLATPPVGACLLTQLPALLRDPALVRSGYALEASVMELTFVFGPPLALCIGALWSTGTALAAGAIVLWPATVGFAAQPASRGWRPAPARQRPRGGSLRTPAMRTLVVLLVAVGVLLGADEVAVVAAAKTLNSTTAAAPLLALWGIGSFAGGLLAARLGGGARTSAGLALVLGALTAGHLALIPAAGSVLGLGGVLMLAGVPISPTEAAIYAMVDRASPAGTMTEAFAWLATATAAGGAIGAAGAGPLVEHAGPTAGFALAGAAGALAVLTTLARSHTITPPRALSHHERQLQGDIMKTDSPLGQTLSSLVATRWRLDSSASTARFRVPHFWRLVTVKGHFTQLDGYLELTDGERQMMLTIDAASLCTGISKRDQHLRSGDFFNTDTYPEVCFRSSGVSEIAENRLRIDGELHAAGKHVPLTLEPTIKQTGDTLEIDVTTTVDQRQLGMTWSPLGMTRSPVTLSVHASLRCQR